MKLRYNVITVMVIVSFLLVGTTSASAQGLYSNTPNTTTTTESTGNSGGGGIFRAGEDGEDGPGAPGPSSDPEPIGEGILILSLLSGAYALIKRNLRNKYED